MALKASVKHRTHTCNRHQAEYDHEEAGLETLAMRAIKLILSDIKSPSLKASEQTQLSRIAEIEFRGCVLGTNATGANARVALALASSEFLQKFTTILELDNLRKPDVLLEDMARHDAKPLRLAGGPEVVAKSAK